MIAVATSDAGPATCGLAFRAWTRSAAAATATTAMPAKAAVASAGPCGMGKGQWSVAEGGGVYVFDGTVTLWSTTITNAKIVARERQRSTETVMINGYACGVVTIEDTTRNRPLQRQFDLKSRAPSSL